jgi:DNA polymerase (family 10)
MLPGVSAVQEAALRRGGWTRKKLEGRFRRNGASDSIVQTLPIAARAELEFSPEPMELPVAVRLAERLREHLDWAKSRVVLVGSARRGKPVVKDLDLLLFTVSDVVGLEQLRLRPTTSRNLKLLTSYSSGPRRRSAIVRYNNTNYRVDFFLALMKERPFALFHHTGSSRYNIRIRAHAKARGWRLNQYGLYNRETNRRVRGSVRLRTEAELAHFLGISYRAPDSRER